MGRWELQTADRGWMPVAENSNAVMSMTVKMRHSCYVNPMCPTYTGVRWNDAVDYMADVSEGTSE